MNSANPFASKAESLVSKAESQELLHEGSKTHDVFTCRDPKSNEYDQTRRQLSRKHDDFANMFMTNVFDTDSEAEFLEYSSLYTRLGFFCFRESAEIPESEVIQKHLWTLGGAFLIDLRSSGSSNLA